MKKEILTFMGIALILVGMTSCGNDSSTQRDVESSNSEIEETVMVEEIQINDPILKGYMGIKNALVATDLERTHKEAIAMAEGLGTEADSNLVFHVKAIEGAEDVESARVIFEGLSEIVYMKIKENEENAVVVYKQFCPMAFDNKGAYWLSTEKEVRNPYFGDKMLKCGVVEETIE